MRKTVPLVVLLASFTVIVMSCNRDDQLPNSLDVGVNALLDESSADTALESTDSASEEPAVVGAVVEPADAGSGEDPVEYPSVPPLDVVWTDDATTAPCGSLSFQVTNTSVTEKEFSVALKAEGLIGEAIRQIGEGVLAPGETIKVDTGNVAAFEDTINYQAEMVKGFKNVLFGGEGLFLTTLTGPGKVWLQTMNLPGFAKSLIPFLPKPSN